MGMQGVFEHYQGSTPIQVSCPMSIADAANLAGLVLNTSCGHKGICGGCAVDLLEGTYRTEGHIFTVLPGQKKRVLACKTEIMEGDFNISVPRRSLVEAGEQIVGHFYAERLKHIDHLDPMARKLVVKLKKPSLKDSQGDLDRLKEEINSKHCISVTSVSPTALRRLPEVLTVGDYQVVACVARQDNHWHLIDVQVPNRIGGENCYAVAVDIGTTTVVVSLVDLQSAKIIDTASCYNQQIQQADDVATRIVCGSSHKGLKKLQRLLIDQTINPLIQLLSDRHDIRCDDIVRIVAAGNTVMWHLFLGADPSGLGAAPFQSAANIPSSFTAESLGLAIHADAPVDIVPSISAYVGGDVVGDIHTCGMNSGTRLEMMVDIGTNGEIAISDADKMLVTACAAGPAFEGLRISCGMRAAAGAIERIKIDPKGFNCRFSVIANGNPVGICGSGLIDFLADALRVGLINHAGRYDQDLLDKTDRLQSVERDGKRVIQYVVADKSRTEDGTHAIVITEKDIETLLQAKAAIFAAINILLGRLGRRPGDLQKVYLAGGFARYIDVRNAITIGMLPELPVDQYVVLGNVSLAGAFSSLIDNGTWQSFERIIETPQVVELNLEPNFQDEYTFALFLPNMQRELFAATVEELNL